MPSPPPTFNFDEDPVVNEPAYNYKPAPGGARWLARSEHARPAARPSTRVDGHAHGARARRTHEHNPKLQHHFYSMEQQLEASILGMWVFLVTEIMFFGGLFMAYIVYRMHVPGGVGRRQQPPERAARRAQHGACSSAAR